MLSLALAGCNGAAQPSGLCETYAQALRRTEVQEALEQWFERFPKTVAESGRQRHPSTVGYGTYHQVLDLDPALLGMGPRAHVEFNADKDGKVDALFIVEKRGAGFVFKVNDDSLAHIALPTPRTAHVGVLCLTRETVRNTP